MSEIIIGHCPECGCPIYQEEFWAGSGRAPAIYACKCYESQSLPVAISITEVDLTAKRQKIKEGLVWRMIKLFNALDDDEEHSNRKELQAKHWTEALDDLFFYFTSQGIGLRVELKIPENPYHVRYEFTRHLEFDGVVKKFLELNEGGFKPL